MQRRSGVRSAIFPGTSLPGQPGNVALSGHRDTFFRPLRNIRENDIIVVTTLARRVSIPRRVHANRESG